MTYQQAIKSSMELIAQRDNAIFAGYNLTNGSKAYGTMADVPREKVIECPVAEQLMTGLCIGLALDGMLPVLIFERMDFMLLAADQIINHLSKMWELSGGQFNPKVIIRAIVGHDKPFNPGPQHLGDYADFFAEHCSFPVIECRNAEQIIFAYNGALVRDESTVIVEYREAYCQ